MPQISPGIIGFDRKGHWSARFPYISLAAGGIVPYVVAAAMLALPGRHSFQPGPVDFLFIPAVFFGFGFLHFLPALYASDWMLAAHEGEVFRKRCQVSLGALAGSVIACSALAALYGTPPSDASVADVLISELLLPRPHFVVAAMLLGGSIGALLSGLKPRPAPHRS